MMETISYWEIYRDAYWGETVQNDHVAQREAGVEAVAKAAKLAALEEVRSEILPPLNWNLNPFTRQEEEHTLQAAEVYRDVDREIRNLIDATRGYCFIPGTETGFRAVAP